MSRYHGSKILRSRNFATMVTWRNDVSLLQTVLLIPKIQNTYIFFSVTETLGTVLLMFDFNKKI